MTQNNQVVTRTYLDKRLGEFKTELKSELKEELLEIKDEIMGELKKIQENDEVHQFSHSRINDDLAELDTRVRKIEKSSPAHS